jgi:hypothetical protein
VLTVIHDVTSPTHTPRLRGSALHCPAPSTADQQTILDQKRVLDALLEYARHQDRDLATLRERVRELEQERLALG